MSKETGSFESIIRGVSEQVPHDRFVGQHWTQDNMVSDPVRGLARRHGSISRWEVERPITLSAATQQDAGAFKEYTFFINSVEYSLMYRSTPKVVGSTMTGVVCINKDTYEILNVLVNPADAATVLAYLDGGISAVGNIAKYLILAPRQQPPTMTQFNPVESDYASSCSVAWVKSGTYSRTYRVSFVTTGNFKITATYTTPTSYYPGTLDTSDIPSTATDYQKQVNDRVYAYQTAVNQWIGTSAAAIQPAAIASQLRSGIILAGMTPGATAQYGSHIVCTDAIYVEVDDGGDGSMLKGIAQEVQSVADLSPIHLHGKTVRIRPKGVGSGDDAGVFYVVAKSKDGLATADWKEVIWSEGPGIIQTPAFMFMLGEIIGNNLYLASSQAHLQAVSGDTNQTPYSPSKAGDLESQPIPGFFGKRIDYIGVFQDRLLLIAGSTVCMSKSGDYFNFYRASALTVADDDPLEMYALGSEGDVITDGVMMDRSLLLFGKQQQYALDGRSVMTPKTQYIATQSSYEDTTTCPPVGSGNYIFFSQLRDNRLTIQQMQTGDYADSFRAFEITSQLDGFLSGTPRQILALTSPSALFIRTQELQFGFYVFNYLDTADQSQRLYDSWSRWTFAGALGTLVGLTARNGSVLALTLRFTQHNTTALCLDEFSRSADLSTNPYLDSMRSYAFDGSIGPDWTESGLDVTAVALPKSFGQYFLLGQPIRDVDKLQAALPDTDLTNAMMGTMFESSFEPTSPYMRDQKEKAILDGTLILGSYKMTLSKSAAMEAYLRGADQDVSQEYQVLDWIHRPAGSWMLNVQQIASTITVPIDIQQEIREFRLRVASRNWLPLTISSIEWAGQFFTQRNA